MLIEVIEDVFGHIVYATWIFKSFLSFNVPNITILHAFFFLDSAYVGYAERKHIVIAYCIYNGIRRKLPVADSAFCVFGEKISEKELTNIIKNKLA